MTKPRPMSVLNRSSNLNPNSFTLLANVSSRTKKTAPTNAPTGYPSPPMTAMISTSIVREMSTTPGEMLPRYQTPRTPDRPATKPPIAKIATRCSVTRYPRARIRRGLSRTPWNVNPSWVLTRYLRPRYARIATARQM